MINLAFIPSTHVREGRKKDASVIFIAQSQEDLAELLRGLSKLVWNGFWYKFEVNVAYGLIKYSIQLDKFLLTALIESLAQRKKES